jgi:hypothetical protein
MPPSWFRLFVCPPHLHFLFLFSFSCHPLYGSCILSEQTGAFFCVCLPGFQGFVNYYAFFQFVMTFSATVLNNAIVQVINHFKREFSSTNFAIHLQKSAIPRSRPRAALIPVRSVVSNMDPRSSLANVGAGSQNSRMESVLISWVSFSVINDRENDNLSFSLVNFSEDRSNSMRIVLQIRPALASNVVPMPSAFGAAAAAMKSGIAFATPASPATDSSAAGKVRSEVEMEMVLY